MHLELLYCPFSTENVWNPFDPDFRLTSLEKTLKHVTDDGADSSGKSAVKKKADIIIRGVLSVTVVSAEGLPATDIMGKSDPFVVLTMKKSDQKNKTRVPFLDSFLDIIAFLVLGTCLDQVVATCFSGPKRHLESGLESDF